MNEQQQAYPLAWPSGYVRTKFRDRSRFKVTFGKTVQALVNELRLLDASYPVISTNVPLRRDGLPYSGQAQPYDPGVAVYFLWKGQQRVLACDKWDRVEDNIHAIELCVEAMRGLDRWGVSQMLDRAFAGFTALPPPSEAPKKWWDVLKCQPRTPLDMVEATYRHMAKTAHPDAGGSSARMAELNRAIEEARRGVQ